MFENIPPFPGDPIFSLLETFLADTRAGKINLGVGVYQTEEGKIPLLPMVAHIEQELASQNLPRSYLPMDGTALYKDAIQKVTFGPSAPVLSSGRLATVQTIGGSGALKTGADFIKTFFPSSDVWLSDPTWDNHRSIFQHAGITCHSYPYYDANKGGLVFDAMLACLNSLPAKSVVLMQPSCHNPTGIDLTTEQWQAVIKALKARDLLPFMDMAYQGLGEGFDEDMYAIRALVDADIPFFTSYSFSKNMSLYGERCGGLTAFCKDAEEATRVLGQLKACIRSNYSNPPTHGAAIVAKVVQNEATRKEWQSYVDGMRKRIQGARHALYEALKKRSPQHNFDYLIKQTGMFSYTGLSVQQIDRLREEFGVYVIRTGRICVAAINGNNVDDIAEAFVAVLQER